MTSHVLSPFVARVIRTPKRPSWSENGVISRMSGAKPESPGGSVKRAPPMIGGRDSEAAVARMATMRGGPTGGMMSSRPAPGTPANGRGRRRRASRSRRPG